MQPASSSLEAQWPDLVAAVSAAIDLEATARTSGALVRRRAIRSAEMLLRLALAYGPGGLSLRAAAAWAGASGLADLSDTAVMKRLRQAAPWLGEVAGALLRRAAAVPPTPGPLPGRRLRIADGSMITGPGGKPKWRLHAAYDPVAGRFTDLDLTDERGAEGFGRTPWQAGEVALGDRCYARPPALRQLLAAGADFIVRTGWGWTRLRLLDAAGAPLAWEPIFDALAPGEVAERAVAVDHSGQGGRSRGEAVFPARLVVLVGGSAADRAGGGGAGGQGAAPAAEPVPLAPAAATADHAGHRLPDAGHLAARRGAGDRGAGGVSLALAGGTRVQAAQEPAGSGPIAGQERRPGPQLAVRPPHPGLADRGYRQDAPGASPLDRRQRTDAAPRSGASRRCCVTRSSPPYMAC
jgi:hypothetical protein